MNGSLPQRPEWVRAINEGSIDSIRREAERPFDRNTLLEEACARQAAPKRFDGTLFGVFGHPEFPLDRWMGNLDRVLHALETEAELTILGRSITHRFLMRLIEVRIQIMNTLRSDAALAEQPVEKPLFIAGAPRTGTTILFTLLAADDRRRTPLGWELLRPVPPPSADPGENAIDPRIALADRELVRPQEIVGGLESIHVYGGNRPKECLSAMSFEFQSEEFTARYHVPSYANWLESSDMRPAYAMHRLVLQILARNSPNTAWTLKSPVHLHDLPTLFEFYPDARVAVTHRDPIRVVASLTSLIAHLRYAHSDHVDPEAIARAHHARYQRSFERLVDWTNSDAIPSDQIHHSRFADFQTDPVGVVTRLYARFGLDLNSATRDAIESAAQSNPKEARGAHQYLAPDPSEAGDLTRSAYQRYQETFDVPSENKN